MCTYKSLDSFKYVIQYLVSNLLGVYFLSAIRTNVFNNINNIEKADRIKLWYSNIFRHILEFISCLVFRGILIISVILLDTQKRNSTIQYSKDLLLTAAFYL